MITNGMMVKDVVTGFTGRVMGLVSYWTGCDQVLVVPAMVEVGKRLNGEWFDITRVEQVSGSEVLELPGAAYLAVGAVTGADQEPPTR